MAYTQSLLRPNYFSILEIPTSTKFNRFVSSTRDLFSFAELHQHTGLVDGMVLSKFGDQNENIFVHGRDQKLGINVSDPDRRLDINGDVRIFTSGQGHGYLTSTGGLSFVLDDDNNDTNPFRIGRATSDISATTMTDGVWGANVTELFRVQQDGNAKVYGGHLLVDSVNARLRVTTRSAAGIPGIDLQDDESTEWSLNLRTDASNMLQLNSSLYNDVFKATLAGRVGINIAVPAVDGLHIYKPTDGATYLRIEGRGGNKGTWDLISSEVGSNKSLAFYDGSTEHIKISTLGVGIGEDPVSGYVLTVGDTSGTDTWQSYATSIFRKDLELDLSTNILGTNRSAALQIFTNNTQNVELGTSNTARMEVQADKINFLQPIYRNGTRFENQNIKTSDSPTFANLTITTALTVSSIGAHGMSGNLDMNEHNITEIGTLGASGNYVNTAYISTLYLGDLNLKNKWKLDDSTDELIWISPDGKKYKMKLEEV